MTDLFSVVDSGAAQAAPIVCVELAGPPRGKGRPRFSIRFTAQRTPYAHVYSPPETVEYEGWLKARGEKAMAGRAPFDGPLALRVYAMMPIPKSWSAKERDAALTGQKFAAGKPDPDNILKTIGDGLNGVVWADDAQIVRATIIKEYGEHPGVIVEVYRL